MKPELQTKIIETVNACDGWCEPEKAIHLANIVLDNAFHTVVEIGIFGGKSFLPMAMACQSQGFGVAHGIDPWTASAALEGENDPANDHWWSERVDLERVYRAFIQRVLNYELTKECFWYRAKSEDVVKMFSDGSVGLVHCDGNHSEKKSTEDVAMWLPKLRENGVFVMDDANWPTTQKAIGVLRNSGFASIEQFKAGPNEYLVCKK